MTKQIISYVEFKSGEIDGMPLKGQALAHFFSDTSYDFHPKFQLMRQTLEDTGIIIPRTMRKDYNCIRVYLGDTAAYRLFIKAFKEIYLPKARGLDLKWVDIELLK